MAPDKRVEEVANFLAVMAYPFEDAERNKFALALQSYYWKEKAFRDRGWSERPQLVRPDLLLQDNEATGRICRKGMLLIWTNRYVAVEMYKLATLSDFTAYFRYQPSVTHRGSQTSDHTSLQINNLIALVEHTYAQWQGTYGLQQRSRVRDRMSVNDISELIAEHLNSIPTNTNFSTKRSWDRDKVINQIWSKSIPVIHLAMATRGLWKVKRYFEDFDLYRIVDGAWFPEAVIAAQRIRADVIRNSKRSESSSNRRVNIIEEDLYLLIVSQSD